MRPRSPGRSVMRLIPKLSTPSARRSDWKRSPVAGSSRAEVTSWPVMATPTLPIYPVASAAAVGNRVLILSWEFPPIVEGGLARHVRKLTEQLAAEGHDVHVLTRGGDHAPAEEERHGVIVHRVREPAFPRDDLDAFLAWVAQMNADMLAAGAELLERFDFDLVHSHDWLVAVAAQRLAVRIGVPWVVTVHATEHGRHQGWVDKHPQSHIHAVEKRMV